MVNYERTEIRKDENAISFSKEWKDKEGLTNRVEVREVKGAKQAILRGSLKKLNLKFERNA